MDGRMVLGVPRISGAGRQKTHTTFTVYHFRGLVEMPLPWSKTKRSSPAPMSRMAIVMLAVHTGRYPQFMKSHIL